MVQVSDPPECFGEQAWTLLMQSSDCQGLKGRNTKTMGAAHRICLNPFHQDFTGLEATDNLESKAKL